MECLYPLQRMSSLKSINLAGNPLCDVLGYPFIVFSYLPDIEMLNCIERTNYVSPPSQSMDNHVHTQNNALPPIVGNSDLITNSIDNEAETRLDYAMLQLNAMNRAFESQEKLLADRMNDSSFSSDPSFPFNELLGHWRQQVLKLLTERQILERDIKNKQYDHQLEIGICLCLSNFRL